MGMQSGTVRYVVRVEKERQTVDGSGKKKAQHHCQICRIPGFEAIFIGFLYVGVFKEISDKIWRT